MSSNDFYALRAQWKRQVKSLFKLPVNGSFSPRKQDISLIRCHLHSQRRHCLERQQHSPQTQINTARRRTGQKASIHYLETYLTSLRDLWKMQHARIGCDSDCSQSSFSLARHGDEVEILKNQNRRNWIRLVFIANQPRCSHKSEMIWHECVRGD